MTSAGNSGRGLDQSEGEEHRAGGDGDQNAQHMDDAVGHKFGKRERAGVSHQVRSSFVCAWGCTKIPCCCLLLGCECHQNPDDAMTSASILNNGLPLVLNKP